MRESSVAAFSFLIAMIVIPAVFGYAAFWWLLHYTNTGLLVFKEDVAAATPTDADGRGAETVLHCSYFTGSKILLRKLSSGSSTTGDEEEPAAMSCPWRIDVSS